MTKTGELVEILSLLMTQFTKLAELEKSLGNGQPSKVVFNRYSELLFKVLTHQSSICREQFLKGNGVEILKNMLKTASSGSQQFYEMYLYGLGMVPALLSVNECHVEDFLDAGFIPILSR